MTHVLRYTTYLFLFLLPWQTIFILREVFIDGVKWEYGTVGFFATELLAWLVVLLFMVWYVKKRNWKLEIGNFTWSNDRLFILSLLLFTIYGLLIAFSAGDSTLAFQHGQWVMLGALLFLLFYIGPVKAKPALWAFVLGSIPVSMLGIWQFLSQSTFASTLLGLSQHVVFESGTSIIQSPDIGRWLRAYGSFSHPNVFGGYLVFAIAGTLLLSFSAEKWKRVALHGIIVVQSAALFFTFSRSAWIAVGIVLIAYVLSTFLPLTKGESKRWSSDYRLPHLVPPLRKGRRRSILHIIIPMTFIFTILLFIYFPLLQTRFAASSSHEVASITERISGYSDAITVFQDHWLFGVGGGNYTYALMQTLPQHDVWWYQPVHNVGALFIVEYGVLGILLLVFVIWSFIRNLKLEIRNFSSYLAMLIPLLGLDHYLWSSFTGFILLVVSSGLYIRYTSDDISPHLVPK